MKAQKAGCGRQMVQKEMCAASVKLCEGKVDIQQVTWGMTNLIIRYYEGF